MAYLGETAEEAPLLEDTPLLRSPVHQAQTDQPPTNYIRKLIPLAIALLILDTSGFLSLGAETAIFEQTACRLHYGRETEIGVLDGRDCKSAAIQGEVAFLIGWKQALETVPGVLCAAPFGALADRIGRKKVLLFSLLGCFLSDTWVRLVCFFPEIFPLRGVLASGMFSFLGGGVITVSSLAWAMVADKAPAEKRTAAFAFVQAALLVSESVAVAMSAPLIAIDPWIPYLAASVWLLAGIAFTICFVTDTPKSKQPPQEDDISAITLAPASLKHRAEEIVRWARANLSVVLLLLSFFVVQLGRQIANILIQYVSIRFSWSISQASYLIMIRSVTSLIILIALPFFAKDVSIKNLPARVLAQERRLTQISGLFLVAGSLVTLIAVQPLVLILGQVLFGLGSIFTVTARSVVTGLIGKQHIGTLYGLIAVTSYGGAVVGGPLIAKAFAVGLQIGGMWRGLPFLITGGLFLLAVMAVSAARVPAPEYENI